MAFLSSGLRTLNRALVLSNGVHTSATVSSGLKKWAYNMSGFNKYGLMHDDCLNDLDADVAEAVRRLPQNLVDERNYRMVRACQLSITKSILPKAEWTKMEDDVRYLQPYLDEVIRERKEREEWDKQ